MALTETVYDHTPFTGTDGNAWPTLEHGGSWTIDRYGTFDSNPAGTIDTNRGKVTLDPQTDCGWLCRPSGWSPRNAGVRGKFEWLIDRFPNVVEGGSIGGILMGRVLDFAAESSTDFLFGCFDKYTSGKGIVTWNAYIVQVVNGVNTLLYNLSISSFKPTVGAGTYGYMAFRVVDSPSGYCFIEFKAWTDGASEPAWATPSDSDTGTKRVDSSTQLHISYTLNLSTFNGQSGLFGFGNACYVFGPSSYSRRVDDFEALEFAEAAEAHSGSGASTAHFAATAGDGVKAASDSGAAAARFAVVAAGVAARSGTGATTCFLIAAEAGVKGAAGAAAIEAVIGAAAEGVAAAPEVHEGSGAMEILVPVAGAGVKGARGPPEVGLLLAVAGAGVAARGGAGDAETPLTAAGVGTKNTTGAGGLEFIGSPAAAGATARAGGAEGALVLALAAEGQVALGAEGVLAVVVTPAAAGVSHRTGVGAVEFTTAAAATGRKDLSGSGMVETPVALEVAGSTARAGAAGHQCSRDGKGHEGKLT